METLEWEQVVSSNIKALAHSGTELFVEFHGGTVYQYSGVTLKEYKELLSSASVGRTFNMLIKSNPVDYPCLRVS